MSRRRHLGITGIQRQQKANEQLLEVGNALAAKQIEQMRGQLAVFKQNLELFANKYKKDIKNNPNFRMHFQKMCQNIGVDPLASNKGFWAELLGFGDFYYQLGIQIIQVCMATRERNGGLIQMDELKRKVEQIRGRNAQDITEDDILRSIKTLVPLGNGFAVVQFGSKKMVQSVPRELNTDQSIILTLAQATGHVTAHDAEHQLSWTPTRAQTALDGLLNEGICWIDKQTEDGAPVYWVTSFFKAFSEN